MESYKRAKKHTSYYLDKVANELKYLNITIEKVIEDGCAANLILECAKKENGDLIILSTHGKFGIANWTLDSTADKIITDVLLPLYC